MAGCLDLRDELREEGPVGPPDEDRAGRAAMLLGEEVEHVAHVLDGLEGGGPPRGVSRRGAHPAQVDGVGRDPPGEEEVHDARVELRGGAAAWDVQVPDLRWPVGVGSGQVRRATSGVFLPESMTRFARATAPTRARSPLS